MRRRREIPSSVEDEVSLNFASWNQLKGWLSAVAVFAGPREGRRAHLLVVPKCDERIDAAGAESRQACCHQSDYQKQYGHPEERRRIERSELEEHALQVAAKTGGGEHPQRCTAAGQHQALSKNNGEHV